ncbi:MAG: hypothetical protein AB7O68_17320 [Pirellulales bacterium]
MDEKPKSRWFQVRISTLLILTAIVAWGMVTWPHEFQCYSDLESSWADERYFSISFGATFGSPLRFQQVHIVFGIAAVWPALALATFLSWKAAWAVIARRRAKRT